MKKAVSAIIMFFFFVFVTITPVLAYDSETWGNGGRWERESSTAENISAASGGILTVALVVIGSIIAFKWIGGLVGNKSQQNCAVQQPAQTQAWSGGVQDGYINIHERSRPQSQQWQRPQLKYNGQRLQLIGSPQRPVERVPQQQNQRAVLVGVP